MLPTAIITHRLPGRVRLHIDSRKGDAAFFQSAERRLKEALAYRHVAGAAITGSLVVADDQLDVGRLRRTGQELALFTVSDHEVIVRPVPLAQRMVAPLRWTNHQINRLSEGALDLTGALIIGLIGFGLLELARGDFRRPPWYTLFWYAFGLFSKTLFDELSNAAADDG